MAEEWAAVSVLAFPSSFIWETLSHFHDALEGVNRKCNHAKFLFVLYLFTFGTIKYMMDLNVRIRLNQMHCYSKKIKKVH